jgi:hypothetical protein
MNRTKSHKWNYCENVQFPFPSHPINNNTQFTLISSFCFARKMSENVFSLRFSDSPCNLIFPYQMHFAILLVTCSRKESEREGWKCFRKILPFFACEAKSWLKFKNERFLRYHHILQWKFVSWYVFMNFWWAKKLVHLWGKSFPFSFWSMMLDTTLIIFYMAYNHIKITYWYVFFLRFLLHHHRYAFCFV